MLMRTIVHKSTRNSNINMIKRTRKRCRQKADEEIGRSKSCRTRGLQYELQQSKNTEYGTKLRKKND